MSSEKQADRSWLSALFFGLYAWVKVCTNKTDNSDGAVYAEAVFVKR